MTINIEFGSLADASNVREEYTHGLHERDDKRSKTVRFAEGEVADHELDRVTARAEAGRSERRSAGQMNLTDGERDRIDFSKERASVPHARSVKAIMRNEGVDDWIAYYDPSLTVDEHREVAERAVKDEHGQRLDEAGEPPGSKMEQALSDQCDHARDHCKHGDPDACEFLGEACGFDENEIATIMNPGDNERIDATDTPFTGPQLGALRRAWDGYQGAIRELDKALSEIERAEENATDAITAINAIRADAGQPPLEAERLDEIRTTTIDDLCNCGHGQLERAVRGQVVENTADETAKS